jgi:hypothetical protein
MPIRVNVDPHYSNLHCRFIKEHMANKGTLKRMERDKNTNYILLSFIIIGVK